MPTILENFHLVAIEHSGQDFHLRAIPLHQDLQGDLAESWGEQYDDFLDQVTERDFDPAYKPGDHELFRIVAYQLPAWLEGETSTTVENLAPIGRTAATLSAVEGIAGFAREPGGGELILLQRFNPSQVLEPGKLLFLDKNSYRASETFGLTLDDQLSAVYQASSGKLLFHNFRTTNTFLPLADYFSVASKAEILDVLHHERLLPENANALATNASQWFRKRFAMLKRSEVLDRYTVRQIRRHAKEHSVDIQTKNQKIVFPAAKSAAKRLLQYLNEELFRGPITETLYETNSKRAAES